MSFIVLAIVVVLMVGEAVLSRFNERTLRARGAVEPLDDVYSTMTLAYPASFVAMAVEGAIVGPPRGAWVALGLIVFVVGKGIKYWAIASLGPRWTFRVLVVPGAPLVTRGPYAFLRHPNYIGVIGELVGVALLTNAAIAGSAATLFFAWLLRRRIAVEERALGRDQTLSKGV